MWEEATVIDLKMTSVYLPWGTAKASKQSKPGSGQKKYSLLCPSLSTQPAKQPRQRHEDFINRHKSVCWKKFHCPNCTRLLGKRGVSSNHETASLRVRSCGKTSGRVRIQQKRLIRVVASYNPYIYVIALGWQDKLHTMQTISKITVSYIFTFSASNTH